MMLGDFRYALRQLRTSPGFTVTAVLTLALGIGANTAIFTLVDSIMLRPLPLPHADRLVRIEEKVAEWAEMYPTLPVSANHFTFWEQHSRSFSAMAAMREYPIPLQQDRASGGRPLEVEVLQATPGVFSVLGVDPQMGRGFRPLEGQTGHEHVVVLTWDLWREPFGGDPGIVGRTVKMNGFPFTVVGVMPASFHMPPTGSYSADESSKKTPLGAIIPLVFSKDDLEEVMGDLNDFGMARLKPGVSLAAERVNRLQVTGYSLRVTGVDDAG
jgi:hypothetical protein